MQMFQESLLENLERFDLALPCVIIESIIDSKCNENKYFKNLEENS